MSREENIRERMKVECVKEGHVNSAEENVNSESYDRKTDNQRNGNRDSHLCEYEMLGEKNLKKIKKINNGRV